MSKVNRVPCDRMQRVGNCSTFSDAKDESQNVIDLNRYLGIDRRGSTAYSHLRAGMARKCEETHRQ